MPPRQDRRKCLVQAAHRLFASRGYYNTSIADILKESGCTRGVLYYYFSSKEELGYAAIDEAMRLIVEQRLATRAEAGEHPVDRLLKALALPRAAPVRAAASAPTDVAVRMASVHDGFRKHLGARVAPLVEGMERMAAKGVGDGQIADSVDPRQLAHVVFTFGVGIQVARLLLEREVIWEDTRRWLRDYLNSLRR